MEPKNSLWRSLTRERKVQGLHKTQETFDSLSITEKALFLAFALVSIVAALSLLGKASAEFSVNIPRDGGKLVEGIVGTPRFINPLLAISDADRDLTAIVYSGLLKATPKGEFIPDLADTFTVSPDGLTYSLTIKDGAVFHDGTPVTAEDVRFTVEKAQEAALKSPRRVNWEGVTIAHAEGHEIVFTLKQPYAPFISNLTLGILPKHLWQSLESDQIPFSSLNVNPVGTGPYQISKVIRSSDGIPTEIMLKANPNYALGRPYISILDIKFFSNEKALLAAVTDGLVESASNLTPTGATSTKAIRNIVSAPLTRVFGVFFNQNENEILAHKEVRKALALATDKDFIVNSTLQGYAAETNGPLPASAEATASTSPALIDQAAETLAKAKWKKNADGVFELGSKTGSSTLSLSLSTANIPELVASAKSIEENWTELGAKVDVQVFEQTDLNQGVIRPRKYDALLFGLVIGKNSDLYPFWHSSQRNDPGLNIAMYTNAKADKALEKMRTATSTAAAKAQYDIFKKELDTDTPAIFLWSPDFIYAIPEKLHGVDLGEITTPSDRFSGIERWYVETDAVWKIFVKDQDEVITNTEN
ncbi:MAG TPA: peptide ABC transporter substrate-binding protein [Candidatus Paceibacterota bacterium]